MVFIKRCFSGKVKLFPLLCSFALTFGISVLALFLFSVVMGTPMLSYINLGIMTVLMNIFLERHNNLIYSVLLHFGFNIVYVFLEADIGFFVILTVLYLVITPIAILIRNKTAERFLKNNDSGERKSKE